MPHIIVADPIHPDGLARLESAPGITFEHPGNAPAGTLAERLKRADGLIVRGTPVDEALLKEAKQLRVVCRHGVGYDLCDVPALTRSCFASFSSASSTGVPRTIRPSARFRRSASVP